MPYLEGEEETIYEVKEFKITITHWIREGQCVTCTPARKVKLYMHEGKQGYNHLHLTFGGCRSEAKSIIMAQEIGELFS